MVPDLQRLESSTAQLALQGIRRQRSAGTPTFFLHVMEHDHIDRIAGVPSGTYRKQPEETYIAMQRALGTCALDQYIWDNPLSMGQSGYENIEMGPTTGLDEIVLDGVVIDSPTAVVEHLEKYIFPRLAADTAGFDEAAEVGRIIASERSIQTRLGPSILKSGHGLVGFPCLAYVEYGYTHYFCAYALYPEVMEKHFKLQAEYWRKRNQAAARAYEAGGFPPLHRLDHDLADSRGTLVSIKSLDQIWFPHFLHALEPMLRTDIKLIWHCDGNLMALLPRLLDCGIQGFQGFQYEDGMNYERLCSLKTRDGDEPIIVAGVSVTGTLPRGTPADVKTELDYLARHGPKTGLFLTASSSIIPGVPWENLKVLWEGLTYYRTHDRHRGSTFW